MRKTTYIVLPVFSCLLLVHRSLLGHPVTSQRYHTLIAFILCIEIKHNEHLDSRVKLIFLFLVLFLIFLRSFFVVFLGLLVLLL